MAERDGGTRDNGLLSSSRHEESRLRAAFLNMNSVWVARDIWN
jgi:hypothetical protein